VIASSDAPFLLLNSALTVVAASSSFCRVFQIDPATIQGRALSGIGSGEWNVPQLLALLRATALGYADVQDYEMDLKRDGRDDRCLIINAHIGNANFLVPAYPLGSTHAWCHVFREVCRDVAKMAVFPLPFFGPDRWRTPVAWSICLILMLGCYAPFWIGEPFLPALTAPIPIAGPDGENSDGQRGHL
jgi:hypothetical protein